jgi:hypothetical protein
MNQLSKADWKMPTIQNVLDSTPKDSGDDYKDRLTTYACLSFYWDGVDRSQSTVRSLRKMIAKMDDWAVTQVDGTTIIDSEDDEVGLQVGDEVFWFICPSLSNMPKKSSHLPTYYRNIINNTAKDPIAVFNLPYLHYPQVTEAIGKVMGFL